MASSLPCILLVFFWGGGGGGGFIHLLYAMLMSFVCCPLVSLLHACHHNLDGVVIFGPVQPNLLLQPCVSLLLPVKWLDTYTSVLFKNSVVHVDSLLV